MRIRHRKSPYEGLVIDLIVEGEWDVITISPKGIYYSPKIWDAKLLADLNKVAFLANKLMNSKNCTAADISRFVKKMKPHMTKLTGKHNKDPSVL